MAIDRKLIDNFTMTEQTPTKYIDLDISDQMTPFTDKTFFYTSIGAPGTRKAAQRSK